MLKRCRMVSRHYEYSIRDFRESCAYQGVRRLMSMLETQPAKWTEVVARICEIPGVWFEDVTRSIDALEGS